MFQVILQQSMEYYRIEYCGYWKHWNKENIKKQPSEVFFKKTVQNRLNLTVENREQKRTVFQDHSFSTYAKFPRN